MATAPYGFRLLVGAATVAVEETIKLPRNILMYPMTLASQAAQIVMRFQQNLAEMAIKGDATLESLFPPKDDQPEWATFDEDLEAGDGGSPGESPVAEGGDGDRRAEGRFALYSVPDTADSPAGPADQQAAQDAAAASEPAVAARLDYAQLTLAQLRARLQSLGVPELEDLLAYELATKARAPFQTLLTNRITRASAK
ncbi:lipid droplet-associated protein [Mycobacterium sp.]|uniref:lipid droplet-associated protein n=1 Tax=Mycobacterium sp. TaxID=1785 RepID=UPI003A8BC38E